MVVRRIQTNAQDSSSGTIGIPAVIPIAGPEHTDRHDLHQAYQPAVQPGVGVPHPNPSWSFGSPPTLVDALLLSLHLPPSPKLPPRRSKQHYGPGVHHHIPLSYPLSDTNPSLLSFRHPDSALESAVNTSYTSTARVADTPPKLPPFQWSHPRLDDPGTCMGGASLNNGTLEPKHHVMGAQEQGGEGRGRRPSAGVMWADLPLDPALLGIKPSPTDAAESAASMRVAHTEGGAPVDLVSDILRVRAEWQGRWKEGGAVVMAATPANTTSMTSS